VTLLIEGFIPWRHSCYCLPSRYCCSLAFPLLLTVLSCYVWFATVLEPIILIGSASIECLRDCIILQWMWCYDRIPNQRFSLSSCSRFVDECLGILCDGDAKNEHIMSEYSLSSYFLFSLKTTCAIIDYWLADPGALSRLNNPDSWQSWESSNYSGISQYLFSDPWPSCSWMVFPQCFWSFSLWNMWGMANLRGAMQRVYLAALVVSNFL
jgi:hypothetical protein